MTDSHALAEPAAAEPQQQHGAAADTLAETWLEGGQHSEIFLASHRVVDADRSPH